MTFPFPATMVQALGDPPGAISGLTSSWDEPNLEADLSWTAPASGGTPTQYRVERRERDVGGAYGAWGFVANVAHPTVVYSDTGCTLGKEVQHRVRAENGDGEGAWSETTPVYAGDIPSDATWDTGYPQKGTDPTAEVDVKLAAGATGTIDFARFRYRVYLSGDPWTETTDADGNATISGLSADTTYEFQGRWENDGGQAGGYTTAQTVKTDAETPAKITGVTVSPRNANGEMRIEWTPDAAAEDYDIQGAPDSGGSPDTGSAFTVADDTSSSPFDETGLATNTKYWFRVRGTNVDDTTGPWSDWVAGTTHRAAPGIVASGDIASCPAPVSIDLTFDHDNSASDTRNQAFEWRRSDDGGSTWTSWNSETAGTTSHTDTGLSESTTYTYQTRYSGETATDSDTAIVLCPD